MQTSQPNARNPRPANAGAAESSLQKETKESLQAVKQDVEDIVSRASEEATRLGEAAKKYGATFAQDRKAGTADTIANIADSLRDTGVRLSDSPNLKSIVDNAADSLDDIAIGIRTRSFTDLYHDAEDFARERPLTIAAGAAIFGLLAARLFKSAPRRPYGAEWTGYDSPVNREW